MIDIKVKVIYSCTLLFYRELDLNSPRGLTASSSAADELGLFSMMQQQHPSSPDSSTDTSKNVCNVCGKT